MRETLNLAKSCATAQKILKAWFNRKFIRSNGQKWPIVDALDGDQEPVTAALTVDEISVLAYDFCLIDDIELRNEIITNSLKSYTIQEGDI